MMKVDDEDAGPTTGDGFDAPQLPPSPHFEPKLPEMLSLLRNVFRLQKAPPCKSAPSQHPRSPLLDPIELYLNSKRLLLKGDAGIFSISSFSHQQTRI